MDMSVLKNIGNVDVCELCGFNFCIVSNNIQSFQDKYILKQDHLLKYHFKEKLSEVFLTKSSYRFATFPYFCPNIKCGFFISNEETFRQHYAGMVNFILSSVHARAGGISLHIALYSDKVLSNKTHKTFPKSKS